MRRLVNFLVVLGLAALLGCNDKSAERAAMSSGSAEEAPSGDVDAKGGGGAEANAVSTAKPDPTRVIIYTAEVTIYVDSMQAVEEKLPGLLDQFGAYVADSQTSRYSGKSRQAKWKFRVPSAQYRPFLAAVGGLGAVESSSSKADDVTMEYVDIEAQLKNKRGVEERLQGILKQQAGKISDVLEVEREIARVREEIERAEGRLRYLRNLSSLSTVTLQVYEREGYQPLPAEPTLKERIGWAWQESTHGLSEFAKSTVVFLVRLAPWLPLWIALAFGIRFLVRWYRRREALKPKKAPSGPDAPPF